MNRPQLTLPQVVDCPEFLVHFPTLVKLAERYGLMMIGKQRFQNYFQVLSHYIILSNCNQIFTN